MPQMPTRPLPLSELDSWYIYTSVLLCFVIIIVQLYSTRKHPLVSKCLMCLQMNLPSAGIQLILSVCPAVRSSRLIAVLNVALPQEQQLPVILMIYKYLASVAQPRAGLVGPRSYQTTSRPQHSMLLAILKNTEQICLQIQGINELVLCLTSLPSFPEAPKINKSV